MMKTLKIGIATRDEMRARTLAIARGQYKPKPDDPKVWLASADGLAKVLSESNRALLRIIAKKRPQSLAELADQSGRAVGNLSRTLNTLARFGLVALEREERRLVPKVLYGAVQFVVPIELWHLKQAA